MLTHPAGEGFLYEVAPVVKYGGKLYASETIGSTTTLYDDMTIENGIILTVNSDYNCYGNIYLKGSAQIITSSGGTITFHNGKGIIAEGNPQILGTSSHKLILDFGSETTGAGIQIQGDTQFIMEYCILKNATTLVSQSLSRSCSQCQVSINHCDFQNSEYAISLTGTSNRVPTINYSTLY